MPQGAGSGIDSAHVSVSFGDNQAIDERVKEPADFVASFLAENSQTAHVFREM